MHLKKKVRVFVKESWKYEERARRLSLTVFQPQTKRGRQRIYRKSKISLGFDWWNRNTRYAKKMHINFLCKKNNKSNKLQCLVSLKTMKILWNPLILTPHRKYLSQCYMKNENGIWPMPAHQLTEEEARHWTNFAIDSAHIPTHVFGPAPYYVYLYFYFIFVWF